MGSRPHLIGKDAMMEHPAYQSSVRRSAAGRRPAPSGRGPSRLGRAEVPLLGSYLQVKRCLKIYGILSSTYANAYYAYLYY